MVEASDSATANRPATAPATSEEIRRRAVIGVGVLGARGVALHVVALGANIVLARLLVPSDFGIVAFGQTLAVLLRYLAEAGLGPALIRRREEPTRRELQALLAFQVSTACMIALLVGIVAWPFGTIGEVSALMIASLPLAVLRVPGQVVLERELAFRPLFTVEVGESVIHHAWAIATVAIGWGVWGLASAFVVRAAAGSLIMFVVAPRGLVLPRFSLRDTRGLLAFGMRFQGIGLAVAVREQAINAVTAVLASVSVLGLWTLASRVLRFPLVLFEATWRVSLPAMSRLLAAGEDPRGVIERTVARAALGTGLLLVPLAASSPALIPAVFGAKWADASDVFAPACLGLMVAGPVSVATGGYLYAVGDISVVLRATILQGAVWVVVTFALLPPLGVVAVGIGALVSNLLEAAILARRTTARTGASILPPVAHGAALGVVCAAPAWLFAWLAPVGFLTAASAAIIALLTYLAGAALTQRETLSQTLAFGARMATMSVRRTRFE
jgi:O-antigen/teichoic acid export membrane protein